MHIFNGCDSSRTIPKNFCSIYSDTCQSLNFQNVALKTEHFLNRQQLKWLKRNEHSSLPILTSIDWELSYIFANSAMSKIYNITCMCLPSLKG